MSAAAGGPAEPAGRGPAAVPDQVTGEAARRGFGALLDVRQEGSAGASAGVGCGGAVVCAVLLFGGGQLLPEPDVFSWWYSVEHFVAVALFLMILGLTVYGLRGLLLGARHQYLYAGGIVHRARSRVRAVAWPDVLRLRPIYGRSQGDAGKVLGYHVEARDGTTFPIAVIAPDGRDPFLDRVIDSVRRNGGTIE